MGLAFVSLFGLMFACPIIGIPGMILLCVLQWNLLNKPYKNDQESK